MTRAAGVAAAPTFGSCVLPGGQREVLIARTSQPDAASITLPTACAPRGSACPLYQRRTSRAIAITTQANCVPNALLNLSSANSACATDAVLG